jgi:hypothetical protein
MLFAATAALPGGTRTTHLDPPSGLSPGASGGVRPARSCGFKLSISETPEPDAAATVFSEMPDPIETLSKETAWSSSTSAQPKTALFRATIAIATIFGT